MPYTLETCSWYRNTEDIQQSYCYIPDVYIMVEHQQAFPVWGTYANREKKSLTLITFDSHADTRMAGIKYICSECVDKTISRDNFEWCEFKNSHRIKRDVFDFEDAFRVACELENDEQIQMAADCGYIDKAYIFTRDEDSIDGKREKGDRADGYHFTYRYVDDDNKTDLDVLNGVAEDFILDIDLDFFIKPFNFNSELGVRMRKLMKEAKVITIAIEPYYFEECKEDAAFTSEKALEHLIMAIKEVRSVDEGSEVITHEQQLLQNNPKTLTYRLW